MEMEPEKIQSVTELMFGMVRWTGVALLIHFIYSVWEFFSHLNVDGMTDHGLGHGVTGLIAAYLFILCWPAIRVALRR